jgi:hypothetical protein
MAARAAARRYGWPLPILRRIRAAWRRRERCGAGPVLKHAERRHHCLSFAS